jgi:hypothetical protein
VITEQRLRALVEAVQALTRALAQSNNWSDAGAVEAQLRAHHLLSGEIGSRFGVGTARA